MIPKKKATFIDYVRSGGWRKIVKTSFRFGGFVTSCVVIYYSIRLLKAMKTERLLSEASSLYESSGRSGYNHKPYIFVPKSDARYGQSLEFEIKDESANSDK